VQGDRKQEQGDGGSGERDSHETSWLAASRRPGIGGG
jgi:hypothetical protein